MKKMLCMALAILLIGSAALAAVPQLSGSLFSAAKQAVVYLASGEYERLVTLLPFSGDAPGAAEWERFSRNYSNKGGIQSDYAVAYWKDGGWRIAVPLQVPDRGSVEVLLLLSRDGATLSGYKYGTWSQVEADYAGSDHVVWNREYVGASPQVYAD